MLTQALVQRPEEMEGFDKCCHFGGGVGWHVKSRKYLAKLEHRVKDPILISRGGRTASFHNVRPRRETFVLQGRFQVWRERLALQVVVSILERSSCFGFWGQHVQMVRRAAEPPRVEQKMAADMPCLGGRVVRSRNRLIDFRRDMPSRRREAFFFLNVQVLNSRKAKCSRRSRSDSGDCWVMAWREMVHNDLARRGRSSSGGDEIWSRQRNVEKHWTGVEAEVYQFL